MVDEEAMMQDRMNSLDHSASFVRTRETKNASERLCAVGESPSLGTPTHFDEWLVNRERWMSERGRNVDPLDLLLVN